MFRDSQGLMSIYQAGRHAVGGRTHYVMRRRQPAYVEVLSGDVMLSGTVSRTGSVGLFQLCLHPAGRLFANSNGLVLRHLGD